MTTNDMTNPLFRNCPTSKMLKNAIARAKRKLKANEFSNKAFNAVRKELAEQIVQAVSSGQTSLTFEADGRLIKSTAHLASLNAWLKDAGLASPTVSFDGTKGVTVLHLHLQ